MIRNAALVFLLSGAFSALSSSAEERPAIEGQVTFLYYEDLGRADAFYRDVLGLENELDLEWVKIYKLSPTSSVGLVNATRGAHRPSSDKPVMVSMVVDLDDVDRFWSFLKESGVDVGDPPRTGGGGNVKAFGFKDPEGYSLEVFAWLE